MLALGVGCGSPLVWVALCRRHGTGEMQPPFTSFPENSALGIRAAPTIAAALLSSGMPRMPPKISTVGVACLVWLVQTIAHGHSRPRSKPHWRWAGRRGTEQLIPAQRLRNAQVGPRVWPWIGGPWVVS